MATAFCLTFPSSAWLLAVVLALIARGVLWRLALGQGRRGPGGLQLGAIELRLAAVWLLSAVFLAILALLLFVALLCFAYAVASTGKGFDPAEIATWAPAVDARGRLAMTALAVIGAGALVWAAARISLAEPASLSRGKVQVLSAWPLTRGKLSMILAGNALIATPFVAFAIPASSLSRGVLAGVPSVAAAVLVVGVWLPMNVGLMAYVHESCTSPTADQ